MIKKVSVNKTRKGFTMIELLVVIAIIAVLSVIGMSAYNVFQKNARNARRLGDLEAIARALEVNKTKTGYIALAPNQFVAGAIPFVSAGFDPRNFPYCAYMFITGGGKPPNPDFSEWRPNKCPLGWGRVSAGVPPEGPEWKVCVIYEAVGGAGQKVICKENSQ